MGKILVVDDERGVLQAFENMLSALGHQVTTAECAKSALASIHRIQPDVIVTDVSMPEMNGLELFRRIQAVSARLPVIVMTGQGSMETAIEATKLGAFDYQLKPLEPDAMMTAIDRAMESVRLMQRHVEFNPLAVASSADAIIGDSAGMQDVFKAIGRVAATDATVLIRGESGTGKELVARSIYQHSLRAAAPLLVVNCAAIPEALLESELFGHERGAFTSAYARKIGKFEQAHGGTIFLDEIGDISAGVQAKILRALEQRTFERVGGSDTIQVDVRVLAATNRDLERAIADGSFRSDLYHRLNVVTISIPPLRERPADIPKLVGYFLKRYADELKTDMPPIAHDAMEALRQCDWPGNVRELEHCLYRTLIFTRGHSIQVSDIARARDAATRQPVAASDDLASLLRGIVGRFLDEYSGQHAHEHLLEQVERLIIDEALRRTGGNQTRAAHLLGLTRPTLHAKLQRLGIGTTR